MTWNAKSVGPLRHMRRLRLPEKRVLLRSDGRCGRRVVSGGGDSSEMMWLRTVKYTCSSENVRKLRIRNERKSRFSSFYGALERTRGRLKNKNVCVIGLGMLGLPVAQVVSKYFPSTVGYDISGEAVQRALDDRIHATLVFPNTDIYVVVVNTWWRNPQIVAPSHSLSGDADVSAIYDCCQKIGNTNPSALVCLESTLPVGTARKMAHTYSLNHVVVCPHRWWSQDEENHGVVQPRVMGALNNESQIEGKDFYATLGVPLMILSSLEMAEMTKIVENSHRYVQLAFAEEIAMIAKETGMDFNELRAACNTKWNVDMPEARDGIGGECLPKDICYLLSMCADPPLLEGALETDKNYRLKQNETRGYSMNIPLLQQGKDREK